MMLSRHRAILLVKNLANDLAGAGIAARAVNNRFGPCSEHDRCAVITVTP
jgi:hypothetical protein